METSFISYKTFIELNSNKKSEYNYLDIKQLNKNKRGETPDKGLKDS